MKRIKSNSGETLVEVMVSMLLFLMILGMLQKAIDFNSNAQKKSEEIRQNNSNMVVQLRETENTAGGEDATYIFHATSADGSVGGAEVFRVPVKLTEKVVNYTAVDGTPKTITFSVFSASAPVGGGS